MSSASVTPARRSASFDFFGLTLYAVQPKDSNSRFMYRKICNANTMQEAAAAVPFLAESEGSVRATAKAIAVNSRGSRAGKLQASSTPKDMLWAKAFEAAVALMEKNPASRSGQQQEPSSAGSEMTIVNTEARTPLVSPLVLAKRSGTWQAPVLQSPPFCGEQFMLELPQVTGYADHGEVALLVKNAISHKHSTWGQTYSKNDTGDKTHQSPVFPSGARGSPRRAPPAP